MIVWLCTAYISPAQRHYHAWLRGTLSFPASKKISIDNEFQHRRQNSFESQNMFDKNLMFTYRNWVHYQPTEDVRFSLSPFANFSNYKVIQKQADEAAQSIREIRVSMAVALQHAIFNRFYLLDRTAIEYRMFENNFSSVVRLRNRFGFRYDVTKILKLSLYDELFFNLSGTTHHYFFDHDRIVLDLEYTILSHLRFDLGYLHITRLPLNSTSKLQENNIFLNLTYKLNNRRCHKKPALLSRHQNT